MTAYKETRTFTHTEYGMTFTADAYTTDGGRVWRWAENNAVCPLDACRDYGIPCDVAAQGAARAAELDDFIKAYRQREAEATPADMAERVASARAAHGPGIVVVDVLTGRKFIT